MSRRGRDRGRGGVPPHPPPPNIEQLLTVQTQLMQTLVQNQQNQQGGGAPRDKRGEFLKGRPPVFSRAIDPLEVDDWLRAVERQLNIAQCDNQQKVLYASDSFREKLRTGGSHSSMDVPPTLLLSPGRSSKRILDLITYQRG